MDWAAAVTACGGAYITHFFTVLLFLCGYKHPFCIIDLQTVAAVGAAMVLIWNEIGTA